MWLLITVGAAAIGVANWRFVEIARTTQPACAPHRALGDSGDGYSAARSDCAP